MTKEERNEFIQIAKDLCYPNVVIEKIRKAKDEDECSKILRTARQKAMDKRS